MMRRYVFLLVFLGMTPSVKALTYLEDIKPVLDKHCTECHDDMGKDPDLSNFPFYSEKISGQKAIVDKILQLTTAKSMPPGNRPKLNQQQINLIRQWRDEGMGE